MSLVLALLTKILVEDPVRLGRLGVAVFRRPSLWPVVSGLAVAGILGSLVIAADGMPSRFPPALRAVAEWSDGKPDIAWRMGRCYVTSYAISEFSSECTPIKRPGVPLVLLWGDSHAAHLYSGLAANQSTMKVDIAQWTVAGCPPTGNPYRDSSVCAAWSARVMTKLTTLKPDTILLAGAWERYSELGP